jgi:hypothetical protein
MSTETTTWSPNTLDLKSRKVIEQLPAMANSNLLSHEQKLEILSRCSHSVLDDTYSRHVAYFGLPQPPAAMTLESNIPDVVEQDTFFGLPQVPAAIIMESHEPDVLEQDTYVPVIDVQEPSGDPNAPPPIYPPYAGRFITSEQARLHRKRTRVPPKSDATDIDRVKRYGRTWALRLTTSLR